MIKGDKNCVNKKVIRPTWDQYFLKIAATVATRATCDRLHVGAVLVRNKVILATGYNGAPRGLKHCDDVCHELIDGQCVRTIHAEANVLVHAAKHGVNVDSSTMYLTNSPCYDCFKMIVNSGIKRVVYGSFYMSRYEASRTVLALAKEVGVIIENIVIEV